MNTNYPDLPFLRKQESIFLGHFAGAEMPKQKQNKIYLNILSVPSAAEK